MKMLAQRSQIAQLALAQLCKSGVTHLTMSDSLTAQQKQLASEHDLARQLVDWYWSDGCRRHERPAGAADWEGNYEQFILPTGTWLSQLYEVRNGLQAVREAASAPRPAVALWGMSQTGKSTSVSALIDIQVKVSETEPLRDGEGGGLHWPGGLPFFFVAPHRDLDRGETYPMHWYERSLNPFNSGLDASSCLSRFVPGATTPQPGWVHVTDPQHPVQVHLVPPNDLLHALARGFDSECLGPALKGKQEEWTVERFDRMLAEFREAHRHLVNAPPDRLAFERMLAVVETLNDLVFARVETFAKLRTNDADWQSRRESLLSDPVLLASPQVVDEFAATVFWCGSPIFTERFLAMRSLYEALMQEWAGRPVYATLPATTLLLDMAACVNAFKSRQGADTREGKQQRLIDGLGYRLQADRVLLGCGPDYPQRLGSQAEHFSNFQGLVWELVVPINVGNLAPGSFRNLISGCDLLDFPGVGRDEKNETNRLNAHPAKLGEGKGHRCTVESFYSDIVKRGKTASIVATYSRRLTVDSFSILQNIDKDEPSNHATDQIANGIRTWLRNMSPDFMEGAGKKPRGVSLNLGLTFWGEFVDQSKADRASNFEMRRKFYGKLGALSDPEVTTIFALNYHWMKSPRVKFTQPFRQGAALYERVVAEPEFQRMFKNPISQQSLVEMTEDLARNGSGGADFLFLQLRQQVESQGSDVRLARFQPVIERLHQTLHALVHWRHLRKPQVDTDTRLEEMEKFTGRMEQAIVARTESGVRASSYALRELFSVDPETLVLPPTGPSGLTPSYIGKLFNEWKNRQGLRFDDWLRRGRTTEPDWAALGLENREQVEAILDALINCFDRQVSVEIAALGRRAWETIPGTEMHRQPHLRRYLAMEMTNRLLYKAPGRTAGKRVAAQPSRDPEATGRRTPAFAAFIGPFVDVQLATIKQTLTPVVLRPPLRGDTALDTILAATTL